MVTGNVINHDGTALSVDACQHEQNVLSVMEL